MHEFLRLQERHAALQEQQLQELTTTRLKKAPTIIKFPILNDKNSDPIHFQDWYKKVLSILATDEWKSLYDPITQDIIPDGNFFPTLNNHLYSALLLVLKDSAETYVHDSGHLWGDGIALLTSLRTAYRGRLTPLEVMQLQGKLLGGLHFRGHNETIEQYAGRTMRMAKDLEDHQVHIPPSQLKSCFISGLGPDFHDAIKDLNKNRLDDDWQPLEIKNLIEPARLYLRLQQNLRTHHASYKSHTSLSDTTTPQNSQNKQDQNLTEEQRAQQKIDRDRKRRIVEAMKNGTFKIANIEHEVSLHITRI